MILDCFIFYNELDLLEYRLEVLFPYVDYFILVEAAYTFTGNPKPYYFELNRERYSKFLSKIFHIKLDDMPNTSNPWDNEIYQRSCINLGIQNLQLKDDDLIMIIDLDEIPNIQKIIEFTNEHSGSKFITLLMHHYHYNANNFVEKNWSWARAVTFDLYKSVFKGSPQAIRLLPSEYGNLLNKQNIFELTDAGWHLSHFGDVNFIINKLKNCSHQEFNISSFNNEENIMNKVQNGKNLISDDKLQKILYKDNPLPPPSIEILRKFFICE